MIHRPFSTAMVDLLLCTVVLLLLLISPPKEGEIEEPAAYRVTMTWQDNLDIDMDQFLMLPGGATVWYKWKDHEWTYLTRDDLGTESGEANREEILIERPQPGEYCHSIHNYTTGPGTGKEPPAYRTNKKVEGDVVVIITDEDGKVRHSKQVPMPDYKTETATFCFQLNKDGKFLKAYPSSKLIYTPGKAGTSPHPDEGMGGI